VTVRVGSLESVFASTLASGDVEPVFLLGAGASVKSGIPLADDLAGAAAKWAYCRQNGFHPEDLSVKRGDWIKLLERQPWFRAGASPGELYSEIIWDLLQPREYRREFFLRMMRGGLPPSPGYERLVDLLREQAVRTVLTTNFDEVLLDACRSRADMHHVDAIRVSDDFVQFSTRPRYPQVVYLHGSVAHYTDRNLHSETQELDSRLVDLLRPLLRDHPLIVVGYRGAELSIMQHLLGSQQTPGNGFRNGVFWCLRQNSTLHPMVADFSARLGDNFQLVPIQGFDEFLEALWRLYRTKTSARSQPKTAAQPADDRLPFDMTVQLNTTDADIDWHRARTELLQYASRTRLPAPSPLTREWVEEALCAFDLARRLPDHLALTLAGALLFGARNSVIPRNAAVHVTIDGQTDVLEGNLWEQLDGLLRLIDEVNQPFLLKGNTTEPVWPYPPLAVKEIAVNALAHRDYQHADPTLVTISRGRITFRNPGGLVGRVLDQLSEPLQSYIARGEKGLRGYRNPVIADLLYGSGKMEKEGSGLFDVYRLTRKNGGTVNFGPILENGAFEVVLESRPEALQVDRVTNTALPSRTTVQFLSNLFEITRLPKSVWRYTLAAENRGEVVRACPNLPPFAFSKQRRDLLTFAPPSAMVALAPLTRSSVEHSLDDPESTLGGVGTLLWLLNECIEFHLVRLGLFVDRGRRRAYFPGLAQLPREITYAARVRRATRTVAKPVISRRTGNILHWEHDAVRFGLGAFGQAMALTLVPTCVFTIDGQEALVHPDRMGRLVTRASARDYNLQVHNHLMFWAWVLSGGNPRIELFTGGSTVSLSGLPADCELPATIVLEAAPEELSTSERPDLEELEEEFASLESQSLKEAQEDRADKH
jgi:NAD-dependent SIR2 family protein deacetylase